MSITFTDKRLYVKGVCEAYGKNTTTGKIEYYSDKFQTGNIQTSVTMGEIRAGLGNGVAAIIPSDSAMTVEFTSADLSMWAKAAQVGGTLQYNAPTMVSQNITATGSTLTVDVTKGTPVAELGYTDAHCYVQEIGAASPIATYGTAYSINTTTGAVTGFSAVNGKQYKVWYFVQQANAQMATISSMFDPKVIHFTARMAVYANDSGSATTDGTRVGSLYCIIPNLKLGGNANLTGEQTTNDTTSLSGQAIAFDEDVISANSGECSASGGIYAYYVFVPCAVDTGIQGLMYIGGVVAVKKGATTPAQFRLVMEDGSSIIPDNAFMTYNMTTAVQGVSVDGATGVITATASATGNGELTGTYTNGDLTFTCPVNVTVVA